MESILRIFLIGHPGAGKMVLAKKLAETLGWDLADLDFGFEHRFGASINSTLGELGAEQFFENCYYLLQASMQQEFCIINCDPGAVDNPDIRKLLNSEFVIFVNIDLQTQILRYKRGIMPLIHRESFDNMLMTLHQQRDEHHEALSNISLNTEKGSIETHIDTILAQLGTDIQKQISHQQRHLFHKDSQTTVTLTDQQIHCLKGLAQGKSSKEIGRDLNISYRTVEGHITNLQNLLGCRNSKELVSLYNEHNH